MCHIIDNVGCGTVVTIFLETRRNDTEFDSSKRRFIIFRESFNNGKIIKNTPEGINHITRYSTNELKHCISARGDKNRQTTCKQQNICSPNGSRN